MLVLLLSGRGTEDSELIMRVEATRKNRDEFFNFIVRVMASYLGCILLSLT